MLRNFFLLDGKPLNTAFILFSYYLSLCLVVCFALFLILEGIVDPFGSLLIWFGILILFIVPVLLRVFFDFALLASHDHHAYYHWKVRQKEELEEKQKS